MQKGENANAIRTGRPLEAAGELLIDEAHVVIRHRLSAHASHEITKGDGLLLGKSAIRSGHQKGQLEERVGMILRSDRANRKECVHRHGPIKR